MIEPSQPAHPLVVLEPIAGEALPSYLSRAAKARFCTRADLGWTSASDEHRHRDSADLELIAGRVGVPVEVLETLTVFSAGNAVTGRTIPYARRTMWRVANQLRHCPSCPPGHRLAAWDLSLTLTCSEHRRLLIPAGWTKDLPILKTGDQLVRHDVETAAAIAWTDDPVVRARLRLTHRMSRLLSLAADAHWPPTTSWLLEAARAETDWSRAATRWTTSMTPSDPVVVAVLVAAAWQATARKQTTQKLATQAWQRIDDAGIVLSHHARSSLPGRPRYERRPRPRSRYRSTSGVSATSVRSQLRSIGLKAHHLPFLLHDSDELLPAIHALPRAHALARLVLHLLDRQDLAELPPQSLLRVGPSSNSNPDRELGLTGQVHPAVLDELQLLLEILVITKQDYRQRRQLLAGLERVPVTGLPGTHHTWPQGAEELAAGWIWAHLTRGPLVRTLHRYRNIDLISFDRALDPEQRLALHEYGEQFLAEPSRLVGLTGPDRTTARALVVRDAG